MRNSTTHLDIVAWLVFSSWYTRLHNSAFFARRSCCGCIGSPCGIVYQPKDGEDGQQRPVYPGKCEDSDEDVALLANRTEVLSGNDPVLGKWDENMNYNCKRRRRTVVVTAPTRKRIHKIETPMTSWWKPCLLKLSWNLFVKSMNHLRCFRISISRDSVMCEKEHTQLESRGWPRWRTQEVQR